MSDAKFTKEDIKTAEKTYISELKTLINEHLNKHHGHHPSEEEIKSIQDQAQENTIEKLCDNKFTEEKGYNRDDVETLVREKCSCNIETVLQETLEHFEEIEHVKDLYHHEEKKFKKQHDGHAPETEAELEQVKQATILDLEEEGIDHDIAENLVKEAIDPAHDHVAGKHHGNASHTHAEAKAGISPDGKKTASEIHLEHEQPLNDENTLTFAFGTEITTGGSSHETDGHEGDNHEDPHDPLTKEYAEDSDYSKTETHSHFEFNYAHSMSDYVAAYTGLQLGYGHKELSSALVVGASYDNHKDNPFTADGKVIVGLNNFSTAPDLKTEFNFAKQFNHGVALGVKGTYEIKKEFVEVCATLSKNVSENINIGAFVELNNESKDLGFATFGINSKFTIGGGNH